VAFLHFYAGVSFSPINFPRGLTFIGGGTDFLVRHHLGGIALHTTMTPLFAALEFNDFAIIAGIVVIFSVGAAFTARPEIQNVRRLERQMREIEQKLDALLRHQGIEMPTPPASDLSPEAQMMAKDPSQKIAAIRLYRREHPGVGLAEAKKRIEDYYETGR